MAEPPEICAGDDFRIAADGTWYHDGAPVRRDALVRLFASVLRRDEDGRYWLVTPVEKVAVQVDDAPFVAVAAASEGVGRQASVTVTTNTGIRQRIDARHPLVVRATAAGPRPYVLLDGGLEALVARSVYYELAACAVEGPAGRHGIWSAGDFFPLEPAGAAE